MRPRTSVGDGSMQSVDDAFTCQSCGSQLKAKAYGTETLYCPGQGCSDISWSEMTVEQRFYFKALRERGNERDPSPEFRETLKMLADE